MLLLLKLLLVPALVAGVTMAARKWGLRVGGLLTALPMVAGPTLCFYAIEQGNGFAANAARATLLGLMATAAWCVAYAHSASRVNWLLSLVAASLAFAAAAAVMYAVELGGLGDLALVVAGLLTAQRLLPSPAVAQSQTGHPGWDLPVRMLAAAVMVVVLTSLADRLGPRLGGLLAAVPVVTVIIGAFTHAQRGHEAVASYFRGLLRGLHSFALFCFVFSSTLEWLGLELFPSVALALLAQLTLQALILWRMSTGFRKVVATTCP